MGLWAGIKYALNSTLGTEGFRPLDMVNIGGVEIENGITMTVNVGTLPTSTSIQPVSCVVAIEDGTDKEGIYCIGATTTTQTSAYKTHFILHGDNLTVKYLTSPPFDAYNSSAVVLNGEIHLLGGGTGSGSTNHYKYTPSTDTWTRVSTLPYTFVYSGYNKAAVVLNDEIHIFGYGGYSSPDDMRHYKWNGTSWVSVSTLPYSFYRSDVVVHNGEIHILGGYSSERKHYKWNGTSWVSVSTLPASNVEIGAISADGELHAFFEQTSSTLWHYKLVEPSNTWVLVERISGTSSFGYMKTTLLHDTIFAVNTGTTSASANKGIATIKSSGFARFMDKDNIVVSNQPLTGVGDNVEQLDDYTVRCTERGNVILLPTGMYSKLLMR